MTTRSRITPPLLALLFLAPAALRAQSPACDGSIVDSTTVAAARPTRLYGPAPVYPEGLLRKRTGGTVRLQFVVDCAGRVDSASVRVVESPDARFSDAAVLAIRHTRFAPATLEGRVVVYRMEQNVRFAVR